ncbi:mRNA-binding phosphate metabolism regulator KNAG_0C04850 [Huiozyma naganishii CBS 8797]|uniref:YTH domain-containing protein n=1 Tax=Huiozyma naganishii (strain ATCC MYA-139 / BCRC 22969 / CBS 8797 / KCTC 17520 / NBRC 10181 / NCYC 3082 / Yp74L-3) TaxID=1071383 RepID=J7S680_HUIN7|nr:hypothetical protein KNAG_0C04850 [Kazachstania naganishii CBS 8797]CCK69586.1 hypothetical protein KNAG_0C04850 [Kazachstania naganishii CBS 8797]
MDSSRTIEDSLRDLETAFCGSKGGGSGVGTWDTSRVNSFANSAGTFCSTIFDLGLFEYKIDAQEKQGSSGEETEKSGGCAAQGQEGSYIESQKSNYTYSSHVTTGSCRTVGLLDPNTYQENRGYLNKFVPRRLPKSSVIIPSWINIPEMSKFFIIKSNSLDHIKKSFYNGIWSSTHFGNKRLSEHFKRAQADNGKMFLLFSVNGSGKFCGIAEMVTDLQLDLDTVLWDDRNKYGSAFKVRWLVVRDVHNKCLKRFLLPNNEMKPVTNSRDTQEIPYLIGVAILKIFKSQNPLNSSELTSFLDIDYT